MLCVGGEGEDVLEDGAVLTEDTFGALSSIIDAVSESDGYHFVVK